MTPSLTSLWLACTCAAVTVQSSARPDVMRPPVADAPDAIEGPPAETVAGTSAGTSAERSRGLPAENVLLLILDDIGKDSISCYPEAAPDARTPVIDGLAERGVRFDRAWSNPACSPTRATVLTGRFGFRTGVGSVKALAAGGLRPEEVSLAESLHAQRPGLRTAFLGKWHLGPTEAQGPAAQGFERFRGTSGNLREKSGVDAYFAFKERTGLSVETSTREQYATSAVVDDALAAIGDFDEDPWLVIASFHAAHTPFHAPPSGLHGRSLKGSPRSDARAHFMAAVDALDAEIGRLLAGIPAATFARTHVIVLSDNGTASKAQHPDRPLRVGKGSLFEDGVCVPLIVAGPAVSDPGRGSSALVNTTDIHSTVHVLLGAQPGREAVDSLSFDGSLTGRAAPARTWTFAERFQLDPPQGRWPEVDRYAIRGDRFKLTVDVIGGSTRLHDLDSDPQERVNLLSAPELSAEAAAARIALERTVTESLKRGAVMAARHGAPSDEAGDEPTDDHGAGDHGTGDHGAGDDEANGTDDRKDHEDTGPHPHSDVIARSPLMRGPLRGARLNETLLRRAVRPAPRLAEEPVFAEATVIAEANGLATAMLGEEEAR